MSYIEKNLSPKEKLILEPKIHWFVLANGPLIMVAGFMLHSWDWLAGTGSWVYNANGKEWWHTLNTYDVEDIIEFGVNLIPFVAIVVGFYVTILGILRKTGINLGITSRRIVYKEGLFHTDTDELSFNDIESVEIHQSPFGKLLDYGNITFNGMATHSAKREIVFQWVSNPSKVRRIALAGLDAYRPPTPKSLL